MEEPFNPELFLSLPPEMQERVIAERPELIRVFSQVNPEYETLLEQQYINQLCNSPFFHNEIDYVTNRQPIWGIMYIKDLRTDENENPTTGFLIVLNVRNLILENVFPIGVEIILDSTEGVLITQLSNINFQEIWQVYNDGQIQHSYNLLTRFNILANRLSCMQINPNHAKNNTLSTLNRFLNSYNEFMDMHNNIDFEYRDYIIGMYAYLIMNKYIFNILDNSKLTKLTNIDENIDDIKHDIEYLFEAIRSKIMSL